MGGQPVPDLSRALDQLAHVIDGVDVNDMEAPTPCVSWTVQDIVDHVVDDLTQFQVSARGGTPDHHSKAPYAGGDFGATFRTGAAVLIEVWTATGDPERTIKLPMGEVPASFLIRQQTAEFLVHAWDIATATGQKVNWDDDIAATALAWARGAMKPEFRGPECDGKVFGPKTEAPEDAQPQEQLVAFFGRTIRR